MNTLKVSSQCNLYYKNSEKVYIYFFYNSLFEQKEKENVRHGLTIIIVSRPHSFSLFTDGHIYI